MNIFKINPTFETWFNDKKLIKEKDRMETMGCLCNEGWRFLQGDDLLPMTITNEEKMAYGALGAIFAYIETEEKPDWTHCEWLAGFGQVLLSNYICRLEKVKYMDALWNIQEAILTGTDEKQITETVKKQCLSAVMDFYIETKGIIFRDRVGDEITSMEQIKSVFAK